MYEQAKLQGTQMGPNGPPNAKGTAQIAPEIANYRKPGVFGHFGRFGQNGHFCHFGQPFPIQGGHAEKKSHWGFACINETEPRAGLSEFIPTGSQAKISTAGAFVLCLESLVRPGSGIRVVARSVLLM